LPENRQEAKKLIQKASRYSVIEGQLFRRGLSTPFLKYIGSYEVWYVHTEVHEGSCGHHIGGKSLAKKSLRAGYFWPTMNVDAVEHVKKCQEHSPISYILVEYLHNMSTPLHFHTWGLDLLGPFTLTTGQLKHLIVVVDYYTKWIVLEALASIAFVKAQNFVFRQIISLLGIPAEIICFNRTQITNKEFREILTGLHIKQYFASVEHLQSNGQAESAIKVILNFFKKRLEKARTNWVEDLYQLLWTTPCSTTGETPFRMVYGADAVIPVEIGQPSWRDMYLALNNEQLLGEDSNIVEEI
jgi:hypothetical protein